VGNAASVSTLVKVPFAGIDWTATSKAPTCTYTVITAVTCTVAAVGNGGTWTAKVMLIDATHAAVSNTTGSTITVTQVTAGQSPGGSPASVTIAQNASASAATFTVPLNNGANKIATITATIVVNGVTYTVNCAVSSA
jgi:hypothetical protein